MSEPTPDDIAAAKPARGKKRKGAAGDRTPDRFLPDIHRLLPQDANAERALLGSWLLAPAEIAALCEDRGANDGWFHLPAHGLIFSHLKAMTGAGMKIDIVTLTAVMREQETLEAAGGAAYITELFTFMPTATNAAYYLAILADMFARRETIRVCSEFCARAYEANEPTGDLVDELQTQVLAINRPDADAAKEHIEHIKRGVLEALAGIEETYMTRGGVVGLRTGFHQLDRMTGGMRGPILIVIAGRPSMGKSALLWNIAEYLAIESKLPVLGFSLEMNMTELASRMICGRAKVNLQRVRDGFLSHEQMTQTMPRAVQSVAGSPIYIDETAGISIQELRVRVRRFIRKNPKTAAVFIDYLQLMSSTSKRAKENRALEIAEISGGLKKLAKEINRPIVTCAQLNRDNDGANALPKLSNLRESGSIEQDADWAILLHRRHYYTKADEDLGKASADLAKQRNGPTGLMELKFNGELARFENPEGQTLYSNDDQRRQGAQAEGDPE